MHFNKKPTGSYRWWGWGRSEGSRRTAAHCERRWWAWLRIEHRFCCALAVWKKKQTRGWRKGKKRKRGWIDPLLWSPGVGLTWCRRSCALVVVLVVVWGWGGGVFSSYSAAVARCGSSELCCPCVRRWEAASPGRSARCHLVCERTGWEREREGGREGGSQQGTGSPILIKELLTPPQVYLSFCLSVYLSNSLSISLSLHSSIHPSVHCWEAHQHSCLIYHVIYIPPYFTIRCIEVKGSVCRI